MLRIEAPIYESHFFNGNASFYSNWDRGQAWYERSLDGLKASLVGEKSPDYLCDPEAPMRIFSLYPRVTIIALLREPVARAYSHWNMIKQQHVTRGTGEYACPEPTPHEWAEDIDNPCGFVVSGRYILHLQRYEKLFPRSALNVFIYEELRAQPKEHEYDEIWRALGVPERFKPRNKGCAFTTPYPVPLDAHELHATRCRLQRDYAPYNERLYTWLGRRISAWDERALSCMPRACLGLLGPLRCTKNLTRVLLDRELWGGSRVRAERAEAM